MQRRKSNAPISHATDVNPKLCLCMRGSVCLLCVHGGSEHTINGEEFGMEQQFVHFPEPEDAASSYKALIVSVIQYTHTHTHTHTSFPTACTHTCSHRCTSARTHTHTHTFRGLGSDGRIRSAL